MPNFLVSYANGLNLLCPFVGDGFLSDFTGTMMDILVSHHPHQHVRFATHTVHGQTLVNLPKKGMGIPILRLVPWGSEASIWTVGAWGACEGVPDNCGDGGVQRREARGKNRRWGGGRPGSRCEIIFKEGHVVFFGGGWVAYSSLPLAKVMSEARSKPMVRESVPVGLHNNL